MAAFRRSGAVIGVAGFAAAAAATVAVGAALMSPATAATYHDSAYGIALTSAVPGLAIAARPAVSSPDGVIRSDRLAAVAVPPGPAPAIVSAGVLSVSAGKFAAQATVAGLDLAGTGQLTSLLDSLAKQAPPQLGGLINQLTTQITASGAGTGLGADVISASCTNGAGTVSVIRGRGALSSVNGPVPANTVLPPAAPVGGLPASPLAITLNKQVRNSDGSLTVTALEVSLTAPGTTVLLLDVASATCDIAPAASVVPPPPPPAPAPRPVRGTVGVTG
ncbi:MAG: hypothetical protein M3042_05755 [Actinomycetota bacterium]|nr:hypothetical protein [Actinomycetota bacterium]